jgi:hypothetical protein
MAAFSATTLLSPTQAETRPSLKEQVPEAVPLVRIGSTSNERTIAAMLLCGITSGDASKRVDDESLASIEELLDKKDDSVRSWVALCLSRNFGSRAKAQRCRDPQWGDGADPQSHAGHSLSARLRSMACGCQFSTSAPIDLLRPYPAEEMKAWKVGRAVSNTRNNDPGLIELMKEEPGPLRLFY